MSDPVVTILLVEDNEDDVFIFRRTLRRVRGINLVQVARDGQEAIDYLSGAGEFTDRKKFPLPSVIILDLKLPRRSGLEVLAWVGEQEHLNGIFVVILTSSAEPRDIAEVRRFGAQSFLLKPPHWQSLDELVRKVRADRSATPHLKLEGDLLTSAV